MSFNETGSVLGPASGLGTSNVTIEFFKADGVTPVSISEAPEPATWALLIIAGLLLTYLASTSATKTKLESNENVDAKLEDFNLATSDSPTETPETPQVFLISRKPRARAKKAQKMTVVYDKH